MFVVGSFALAIAAIVVVGSCSLFKKPLQFVSMFQGNVNGLRIGAPVKFKGVQIGTVEEIKLALSPSEGPVRTHIDCQIEVDVQRFETTSDGKSQLIARWIIKDGAGKDLYASETTASTPVSAGETGASAALSDDLATLSREVAARITELRHTQPASAAEKNVDRRWATR